MARIVLDLNKSVEQNAGLYYEAAKKFKKKIEGAKEALEESRKKLAKLEKQRTEEAKEIVKPVQSGEKEWYEKFRWFTSSEGFLVVGGRDAATNEIIVKKHTAKGDFVFHTDMIGSPFFVIKSGGKEIGAATIKETADATATFSRAWKLGMESSSVFYCKPEQLTKEAPAGEFVPRGGFVTKGKLEYVENKINFAIGSFEGKIMGGPIEAAKKNCKEYTMLEQGNEKASSIAKYVQKKLGGSLDDIIRVFPTGGCRIKK